MNLLFDREQCKALFHDFYTITNIKIVFYDTDFVPVIAVPDNDCDFCATIKKNPYALSKCEECVQKEIKICKKTNLLNIYKCHCGLTEAVAPLTIDDNIIGYIMFGQIINKQDRRQEKTSILSYASQYVSEDMSGYFDKITTKNVEEIQAIAKLTEVYISYLIMHNLIKSDQTSLAFRITGYINTHLADDLSVDKLCKVYRISRNSLYKIFNDYYGMSVAKYIRKKRIEAAQDLIKNGVSVTDASGMVGFYDYNYFSKVFKNEAGILPSKFRKQHIAQLSPSPTANNA